MQAIAKQTLGAATRAVPPKVAERASPLIKSYLHSDEHWLLSERCHRCFFFVSLWHPCPLRRFAPAPPEGEPLACRPGPYWTSKVSLYQKQECPATEGSSFGTMFLVKLLLISVAGHSFLRYIELSAGSRKLPGLPKHLLQGEVARRRRDGEVVRRKACPRTRPMAERFTPKRYSLYTDTSLVYPESMIK